jgi:hypothetical protein
MELASNISYSLRLSHLGMEAQTACKTLETISIFKWFITQEDFTAFSHCEIFQSIPYRVKIKYKTAKKQIKISKK